MKRHAATTKKALVEFARYTPEEQPVVRDIVERAYRMFRALRIYDITPLDIEMDLSAVHAHTPLRLVDLLAADDFNFSHDIGGIRRHLDRETGVLMDCFHPRFARRVSVES